MHSIELYSQMDDILITESVECSPMRIYAVGLVLLLLVTFPIQSVQAEEADGTLQARETQAEFFPPTESTILQWRNIYTTDGLLLDQLRMATYEVHRTDRGGFSPNSINPDTLIAEDIPACYMNDLNEVCSGKLHSLVYEPEPGVQRGISYAVITVLRDGTRTEDVDIGLSQTPEGHIEIVAESVAPEQFSASYDVANQSTVFSWRPACPQNMLSYALYQHSTPATKSTWDSMDKTLVSNSIPANAKGYSIDWSNESVERSTYYSLTCFYPAYCDDDGCYLAREDTRFYSGNTLQNPIVEDNQAPRYGGSLTAQFNPDESQTMLQWGNVFQDDIDKIRIYHSSKEIVSLEQGGIQVLADLDEASIEFIHHLPADWMLTSYYAIGLIDTEGNVQVDEFSIAGKVGPIIERNLPISISSFNIEQTNSTLHFQWELQSQFINGDATLWKSTSPNPDMTPAWEEVTQLNPFALEHHFSPDVMQEASYALTLDGTWGSSPNTHADNRIYLGKNAMHFTPSVEDLVEDFNQDISADVVELPEFLLMLEDENDSLEHGDWVTFQSQSNQSYTLRFTHSQMNSTIRWTDAHNLNPFWRAATSSGDVFSIIIEEPTNLIHIESTDANGEIYIVRVGIDWPDEQTIEPDVGLETEPIDNKQSSAEKSLSMPLLSVIGIIIAYILILFVLKPRDGLSLYSEEE